MHQESATSMIEANTEPLVVQASRGLAVEDRRMQEQQRCEQVSALETTFVSDTQAYGVMFTVRGKKEAILIETLELSSVYLGNQRGIHVMVYTKDGDYQNYQDKPGDWVNIADTIINTATEGRGTLIPAHDFHPVQVKPGHQRAFYVTLDTTDLRYSNSPGRPVGSIYVEDQFLQIHVGAGLLEYPFSSKIFEPRVFCGIVHYKRIVDCNSVTMVDSKVPYHFIVQHDSLSDKAVTSQVNDIVTGTVKALLGSDVELSAYRASADLKVNSIVSDISSTPFNPQAFAECGSNTIRKCTAVVTNMKFSHSDKLSTGDLIYHVLQQRSQVSANLNAVKAMDVVYAGFIPLKTDMILRFDGAPAGQIMNAEQISYLEETTQNFIEDKLVKTPSVDILGIHVKDQSIVDRQHRHSQQNQALASLDVLATVTATLKPPPFLNLRALTEDAIAFNAAEYVDDLKIRRDLQLGLSDSKFFADFKSVVARPGNATIDEKLNTTSTEGGHSVPGWAIFLIVLVILKVIGLLFYLRRRRLSQKYYEKEEMMLQDTIDEDDDYAAQVYEKAFRGDVDDKDTELIYKQGFEENRRTLGMAKAHSMPDRTMMPPSSMRNLATAASTRSMGVASSGYVQSQRSLMSQSSAKDINMSSGYSPSQERGFMAQHSSANASQMPEYSTGVRGIMAHDSATHTHTQSSSQRDLTSQTWPGDMQQSPLSRPSQRMLIPQRSKADVNQSPDYTPIQRGLPSQGSKASISSYGYTSSQRSVVSASSRGDTNRPPSQRNLRSVVSTDSRGETDRPPSQRDLTTDARLLGTMSNYSGLSGRSITRIAAEGEDDASSVGMSARRSEYSTAGSSRLSQRSAGTWNIQDTTSTRDDNSVKSSILTESQRIRPAAVVADDKGSVSDASAVKYEDSMSLNASDHTLKRTNRVTFSDDQSRASSVQTPKHDNITSRGS
jgi:hypothetical protein